MARARILVADDEEGVRESLSLILSEDDYTFAFASSGEEALQRLMQEPFDLALLDIKMPKLDGLEVLRSLRERRLIVPVLILTAYQSVELAKEAVKLGAVNYLPKPFGRDQVLAAVRDALALDRHDA
jgi:DNA-binding NtrC family response regulator